MWDNEAVAAALDSALVKALLSGAAGDLPSAAIEAAVNEQLIHGGCLDTLLLEADVVSEAALARVLCEVSDTEPLDPAVFSAPHDDAVSLLPRRMAVAMGLVPLFLDATGQLHVACRSPKDTELLSEVSGLIKTTLVPHVVPELRVQQGLAAAHGHEVDERFVALLRRLSPDVELAAVAQAPLSTTPPSEATVSWDLVEAMAHLVAQDSRDGIARVAVTYARAFLPFAAVFGVRDGAAVGWHRSGPSEGVQFTRPFTLPDDGIIKTALSQSSPSILSPDDSEGSASFFGWLGRRRPRTVVLIPIIVAKRPVGALYGDGGVRLKSPREVGELVAFGARLGSAFESLLRQRHRQHPSIFPQPATTLPPTTLATTQPPTALPQTTLPPTSPAAPPPETSLPAPPPEPALPAPPPMALSTTPSSSSMPSVPPPRRDGTSPFARGYTLPPTTLPPMPLPGSDEPHQDEASSPSLDAIVITGVGPPLNEHLARASAVEVRTDDGEATAGPFFPLSDELAPEAWQGALRSTVERGLQGGTVADDDDDLNWEDVVYDPAHAAELEAVPATRAPTAESANFTQLSSSVLADLYNVEDDDDDASPATPAPSSAPSSSSSSSSPALTTLPPARLGGDAPMATLSHKDLVELLFAGDEDRVERAGRELVSRGLAAVPALGERFPGRLRVDPFDPGENVRSADRLGPLIDVLARLGADGLDAAIPHIDSRYPAHRFAAVLLFQVTPDPRAIDLLRSRLHDAEPRVQRLAAEALVPFLAHPRFESLLVHLRERATATHKPYPLEARRRAAELLGEFRDVGSVPLLIGLLNGVEMQETARKALRTITVADMGARPKAWEKWWQRAKKRSRLDWLIESLGSEELALRTAAHRELRDLAGDDFGYRPDADKRARQRAIDVWQQWWTEEQQRTVHPKAASQV